MGLDMYLFKCKKPTLLKNVFNLKESIELHRKYNIIEAGSDSWIKEYALPVKITESYYDMERIAEHYNTGKDTCIGGFSFSSEISTVHLYGNNSSIEVAADELNKFTYEKEEDVFVFDTEEVAYWRKANQIRDWFVRHIDEFEYSDNCKYFKCSKELLEELIFDCEKVLANHELAPIYLPTQGGFFFGDTEYDEYYYQVLSNTVDQLTQILENTDFENEIIAYYDWW